MGAALKRTPYDRLLELPTHLVGEILSGELHVSPHPRAEHSTAALELGSDLGFAFRRGRGGPGGWRFLPKPELHLGGDVLVPDLAGWRLARMPQPPNGPFLTLAPDWVCEILSPGTARIDRIQKGNLYAQVGVAHLWLLDPGERFLEVYRLHEGRWLRVGVFDDSAPLRAEPFDAIELDLRVILGGDPATSG